jgi:hypothetical protein
VNDLVTAVMSTHLVTTRHSVQRKEVKVILNKSKCTPAGKNSNA